MWYLEKRINISIAHYLRDDMSCCSNNHGHNLAINVYCKGDTLNSTGMIFNLSRAKTICFKYDHTCLNDWPEFKEDGVNPTMENFTKYLCEQIPFCYKVTVQESLNNIITYEK